MNKIKLSKDKKEEMVLLIKEYFLKEKGEELGDLAATLYLDFIIRDLAPEFYNQGVNDSYLFLNDKIEDIFALQIYKK